MTIRILRRARPPWPGLAVDWAVISPDGRQRCGSAGTREEALRAALVEAGVEVEELREVADEGAGLARVEAV